MASPRKQRRLEGGDSVKTPKKEDEERNSESLANPQFVFTPIAPFDWAEESAREYEQDNPTTEDKTSNTPNGGEAEGDGLKTSESGGPANRTRSRKIPTPQRADPRPKFEKSLDQRAALNFVRDERIKQLAAEKRRVEQGHSPRSLTVKSENRKRRHSPSVSTDVSNTPSRRDQKKAARLDDEDEPKSRKFASPRTPSRVLSSSFPSSRLSERGNSAETMSPRPREDYVEPKRGWCTDEPTLIRRTKEIEVTKSRPIYERYCNEVPVSARLKTHPRTPNKYLNHSRRNWDSQVRKWKRSLYEWAGEYCPSSANTSRAASRANSISDDEAAVENNNGESAVEVVKTFRSEKITFALDNPDNMASLLGHFDMTTRQGVTLTGDESTLKAHENRTAKSGPTDFSQLEPTSS